MRWFAFPFGEANDFVVMLNGAFVAAVILFSTISIIALIPRS